MHLSFPVSTLLMMLFSDHHHGDEPEVHRGGEQGDRAAERLAAARVGQPEPVAHQQLSKHPASTHGEKGDDCTFTRHIKYFYFCLQASIEPFQQLKLNVFLFNYVKLYLKFI